MVILGNVVGLAASTLMVYIGILKKKKKILFLQCIELSLYVICDIILGGISGIIINSLAMLGNILGYNNKLNLVSKIILTITSTILIIIFNKAGILGYFPLACMILYLWTLDIKNIIVFKSFLLLIMVFWGIYDYSIKSYVASLFDIFTIITIIISMVQIKKVKKKNKKRKK